VSALDHHCHLRRELLREALGKALVDALLPLHGAIEVRAVGGLKELVQLPLENIVGDPRELEGLEREAVHLFLLAVCVLLASCFLGGVTKIPACANSNLFYKLRVKK